MSLRKCSEVILAKTCVRASAVCSLRNHYVHSCNNTLGIKNYSKLLTVHDTSSFNAASHVLTISCRSFCTLTSVTLCRSMDNKILETELQKNKVDDNSVDKQNEIVEEDDRVNVEEFTDNDADNTREQIKNDDHFAANNDYSINEKTEEEKQNNDDDDDDDADDDANDDDDDDDDNDESDDDDDDDSDGSEPSSFLTNEVDMESSQEANSFNTGRINKKSRSKSRMNSASSYIDVDRTWNANYTHRRQLREVERVLRFVELLSPANIHKYVNTSEVTTPDGVRWLDIYAKPALWRKVKSARIVEGDFTLAVIKTLVANTPVEHMYSRLINTSALPTVMFDENCVCLLLRTPHVKFEWNDSDKSKNADVSSNSIYNTNNKNDHTSIYFNSHNNLEDVSVSGNDNRSTNSNGSSSMNSSEGYSCSYSNCSECSDWRQAEEIREKASMLERLRAYDMSNTAAAAALSSSSLFSSTLSNTVSDNMNNNANSSNGMSSAKIRKANAYKQFLRDHRVKEKPMNAPDKINGNVLQNGNNRKGKKKKGSNNIKQRRRRERQRARRRMWNKLRTLLFGKAYLEKQKAMNAALKAPTTHDLTDRLNIFIIREPHPITTYNSNKDNNTNKEDGSNGSASVTDRDTRVLDTSYEHRHTSSEPIIMQSSSSVRATDKRQAETIQENEKNSNTDSQSSKLKDTRSTESDMRWRIITIHREPNIFIQHIHLHWHLFAIDYDHDDRLFIRDKCTKHDNQTSTKTNTKPVTSHPYIDNIHGAFSTTNQGRSNCYSSNNKRNSSTVHRPHVSFANLTKTKEEEEEEVRSFDWKSAEWHQAAHIEHWLPFHHTAGSWESVLRLIIHGTLRSLYQAVRRSTLALDVLERAIFKEDEGATALWQTSKTSAVWGNGVSTLKERTQFMSQLHVLSREAKIYVNIIREMQDAHSKLKRSMHSPFDRMDRREVLYSDSIRALAKLLNEQSQSLLLLQFNIAMNQMERHLRTLTVFSTFFIPLDFIASCFGTNFPAVEQIEESTNSGFYIVACMLLVAGFVTSRWLKLRDR